MLIFYLVIVVAVIPIGAGIAFISRVEQKHFEHIFGLSAGAVLSIVLMMMVHLYEEAGYVIILVMWGGFLLVSGIEYLTGHRHDVTGISTDSRWGINLTVLGLSLHSLADGLSLVVAAKEEDLGGVLALGILLHRLPVGTLIAVALLRNQTFVKALVWLIPLMAGPIIGAVLGEQLLRGAFQALIEHHMTAFAVGTLLHVVMDGFRGKYTGEKRSLGHATKVLFFIGFILTFCIFFFFLGSVH